MPAEAPKGGDGTQGVLRHLETRIMPEITMPEPVANDLIEGTQRILSRILVPSGTGGFSVRPDAPDTIVLLLRSARLPATALRTFLSSNNIEGAQPQIIEAAIGKIVPLLYIDELSETDEEVDEATYNIAAHAKDFHDWVSRPHNTIVQPIRDHVTTQLNGREPKRVLVLDDAQSTGETRSFSAPSVLRTVLGEGVQLQDDILFSRFSGWEYDIIDSHFPDLGPIERHMMHELIKGSVDARVIQRELLFLKDPALKHQMEETIQEQLALGIEPYPLIPLTDRRSLALLEYHSGLYNPLAPKQGALSRLEERFGMNDLIGLPHKVEEAFTVLSGRIKL